MPTTTPSHGPELSPYTGGKPLSAQSVQVPGPDGDHATPPAPKKRLARVVAERLAMVMLSILVPVAILDVGYRWIVEPEDVIPRSIGQYDSTLGWALKPNSKGTSSASGTEVVYEINSKGLRDRETQFAKPPGVVRVALVGDSRTFGYGVQIEQHFSTILE